MHSREARCHPHTAPHTSPSTTAIYSPPYRTNRTRLLQNSPQGSCRAMNPSRTSDGVVYRPTRIVNVRRARLIVRLTLRNRVPPRKPLSAQPAARRNLPLRFRRQSISVRAPVTRHRIARPSSVNRPIEFVARRQPLLLTRRIRPLHHIVPGHHLHWMVSRFPRSCRQISVSIGNRPRPHRVPLGLGGWVNRHVVRAQRHRHGAGIRDVAVSDEIPHLVSTRPRSARGSRQLQ
jgi:hypothetical protein